MLVEVCSLGRLDPVRKALFIGLVLALLLTPVAFISPSPARASPETIPWNKYPIPRKGKAGGWVLTGGGTGVTAVTVAFDGTIYAAAEEIVGAPLNGYNLFKSTDDGYSWTPLWKIPAGDNPNGGEASKIIALILPRWEDTSTLYLATQYNVYRSTDGGEHFTALGRLPYTSGTVITSFDVIDYKGAHLITVGTQDIDSGDYGGVYLYDESKVVPSWTDLQVGNSDAGTKYDVLAVAFSPNFADDKQFVAVVTDEADVIVTTRLGGAGWGATVGDAFLPAPAFASWAATGASLVFPADYDSDASEGDYIQYVGVKVVNLDSVDEMTGGVYMIVGAETPDNSLVFPLSGPAPVHSMAIAGEASNPTIVAGLTNGSVIYSIGGDSWIPAYPPPSAPPADVYVALGGFYSSGYVVYAGTSGETGGLARSVDSGASFTRIGLISDDLLTITDLAVSPIYGEDGTMYMLAIGSSDDSMLWRTTNGGSTWDLVLTVGQEMILPSGETAVAPRFNKVAVSPNFATDSTVFIRDSETASIWRSVDNGFRFWPLRNNPPTTGTIESWAVVSNKKVFVGDSSGNFYKTNASGLSWSGAVATGLSGFSSMVLSPDYENDQTILVSDHDGNIYLSEDDGETWEQPATSATGLGTGTLVAFSPHYAEDRTIYATDAATDNGVLRFVIDEDTEWERIDDANPNRIEEAPSNITGLYIADDGSGLSVLYAISSDAVAAREVGISAAEGGVARCLNPTDDLSPSTDAPLFEVVNAGLPSGAKLSGLWHTEGHTFWSVDTNPTNNVLYTYEDTLTIPPELVSPADGASSGRQTSADISWQAVIGADSYEIWYDTDPSFKQAPSQIYSEVADANIRDLDSGITYYWRVRVGKSGTSLFSPGTTIAIGTPALSRFSPTWSFITSLSVAEWNPFVGGVPEAPANGASSVPIRPAFAWNLADWATGYELVVAGDSNFADVVISRVGGNALSTPVWLCDTDLEYNTTYYWKVRAISPGSYSQWAVGIFTTEPAPPASAPSPAPPAPPAPPAVPETPVPIWVMIAVVALLVIMLLILIITTRRSH
jgi:photosystem II stability/assembly factor-like uncharacterized protein